MAERCASGVEREGPRGRKSVGGRGRRRGPALRRRQLRHRGRDARPLHGRRPGARRWRRPGGCWSRAARCSSSSTCAAHGRGSGGGRTGWSGPGAASPAAATRTARPTEVLADAGFWIDSSSARSFRRPRRSSGPLIQRGRPTARRSGLRFALASSSPRSPPARARSTPPSAQGDRPSRLDLSTSWRPSAPVEDSVPRRDHEPAAAPRPARARGRSEPPS